MQVSLSVNGRSHSLDVDPRVLLVELLRDLLALTGTKIGCDTSQCGSCCVLVDGVSVKSCTVLAVQADGSDVTTVEGLAQDGELHALQQGFWQEHGLQCGFCTPGMLMSLADLLQRHSADPSPSEIRSWLDGNLCRCTGYQNVVRAVIHAARILKSPVHLVADTPGKQFYEQQVQFLLDKDVDGLVEKHYHEEAVIVSHDAIVRGRHALKAHFNEFLRWVTVERVQSTDKFTESADTLLFEATVQTNHGVIKTFDALVLEAGRIRLQFTGVK
jgi:carbon-monoxide dehydrogenase small subunit